VGQAGSLGMSHPFRSGLAEAWLYKKEILTFLLFLLLSSLFSFAASGDKILSSAYAMKLYSSCDYVSSMYLSNAYGENCYRSFNDSAHRYEKVGNRFDLYMEIPGVVYDGTPLSLDEDFQERGIPLAAGECAVSADLVARSGLQKGSSLTLQFEDASSAFVVAGFLPRVSTFSASSSNAGAILMGYADTLPALASEKKTNYLCFVRDSYIGNGLNISSRVQRIEAAQQTLLLDSGLILGAELFLCALFEVFLFPHRYFKYRDEVKEGTSYGRSFLMAEKDLFIAQWLPFSLPWFVFLAFRLATGYGFLVYVSLLIPVLNLVLLLLFAPGVLWRVHHA
jgi:hypothetical protein